MNYNDFKFDEEDFEKKFHETYKTTLTCFSFTCSSQSKEVINRSRHSNKILLPPNVLHELMTRDLFKKNDIMFFKVINKKIEFGDVCSVHEFTASPGICHVPYHIMEDLGITEGDNIEIEKVSPPLGTYVKLRPHKTAFIELSNPKALLEKMMAEDYPVITQGQTIAINYKSLGKEFRIDIMETQPAEVISIIDTDLNVDFDEPFDYIAPTAPTSPPSPPNEVRSGEGSPASIVNSASTKFVPFSGRGYRLGSK